MKGTDHSCSLNPSELKQLVCGIREVETAIGAPSKIILESELPCKTKLGKTIVTAKSIEAGEVLEWSSIAIKVSQPHGVETKLLKQILGRKVKRSIMEDSPILSDDVDVDTF